MSRLTSRLITATVGIVLGMGLAACGVGATSVSHPKLSMTRHPFIDPSVTRAARYVSFTPRLPAHLPPGYGFQSVQVNLPPYHTSNSKNLTTLVFTFVNRTRRFELTETALKVRLVGASRGPSIGGAPLYVVENTNSGVRVVTVTMRLGGVSYTVIDPGSITLDQVEQMFQGL